MMALYRKCRALVELDAALNGRSLVREWAELVLIGAAIIAFMRSLAMLGIEGGWI